MPIAEQPSMEEMHPSAVIQESEQIVEEVSAFEQEFNQGIALEEEKKDQEPVQSGFTFGYDNEVLLANGIDPEILAELPEEMRAELLSSIDIQPI